MRDTIELYGLQVIGYSVCTPYRLVYHVIVKTLTVAMALFMVVTEKSAKHGSCSATCRACLSRSGLVAEKLDGPRSRSTSTSHNATRSTTIHSSRPHSHRSGGCCSLPSSAMFLGTLQMDSVLGRTARYPETAALRLDNG